MYRAGTPFVVEPVSGKIIPDPMYWIPDEEIDVYEVEEEREYT